jgi:aerobic-type carbon monoxide dehydrogenase small subunit (CoxS/CutS family)
MNVRFTLNGKDVESETRDNRPLLDLLRVDLGVTSVKKGCENGECGACTVLLDEVPVASCLVLAPQVEGKTVTTIDGLVDDPLMETLRQAFLEDGAIQCGFCTPGMLLTAYSLLKENPNPTELEVKKAIEGNICRCTGYVLIIRAILDAAERVSAE